MKIEISTIKITKEDTTVELTLDEARELYWELNKHFGTSTIGTIPLASAGTTHDIPYTFTTSKVGASR